MAADEHAPASPDDGTRPAWKLRWYRDEDEAPLLRLLQAAFDGWRRPPGVDQVDYLRWKLRSHPSALRHHVVAEADGQLVGCHIATVHRTKVATRELLLLQCPDSAVHPDYRGRGLMGQIQDYDLEAMRQAFAVQLVGQTTNPAMVKLRAGTYRPFRNRVEVMVFDGPGPATATPAVAVREAGRFDERVADLWRQCESEFDFAIVREQDYLNWRYADPRAGQFSIRLVEEGERLTGYAVLCVRRRGHIADLLYQPGREDVLNALISDALGFFARAGVEIVDCWTAERHPYRDPLVSLGFRKRRRLGSFGHRPLGAAASDLKFLTARDTVIHLTPGDMDWI